MEIERIVYNYYLIARGIEPNEIDYKRTLATANYLKDNGLKIDKGWTKDIICIKFNYDSRSYEKELEHWQYLIDNKHSKSNTDTIYSENSKAYKFFQEKLENTKNKKDLFNAKTKEEIRELFYKDLLN